MILSITIDQLLENLSKHNMLMDDCIESQTYWWSLIKTWNHQTSPLNWIKNMSINLSTLLSPRRYGYLKKKQKCMFNYAWWRHQMETFSALLALCAGNSPVTVNFSHKGQWRGTWMFSLICTWINGWVNNWEAGDLRRHREHHDVTLMRITFIFD